MTFSRTRLAFFCAAAAAIVFAGCGKRSESIKIDGSSTVYLISAAVAEAYRDADHPTPVTVTSSGTGGGMGKFIAGEIDICDASRRIKDSEVGKLKDAGVEFVELVVAFDGIAVVVNPQNDWIDSMSVEQLATLWRPQDPAQKWSDIDPSWPDEKVQLYGPNPDNGTFEYFTEHIVGEVKSCRSDYSMNEDDNVLVTGVSQDKNALGYFGFAYYTENRDALKVVPIRDGESDPVTPSLETIRSKEYKPLSRPLYIYVRQSLLARPEGADFVKFYIEKSTDLVEKVGYVLVSDEIAAENKQKLDEALAR